MPRPGCSLLSALPPTPPPQRCGSSGSATEEDDTKTDIITYGKFLYDTATTSTKQPLHLRRQHSDRHLLSALYQRQTDRYLNSERATQPDDSDIPHFTISMRD